MALAVSHAAATTRDYFCDISSLASDHDLLHGGHDTHSDVGSQQTMLLYQRLERIEELTANVLSERPVLLQAGHDTFADVEPKCTHDFEMKLPSTFTTTDVVVVTVQCIPDCMIDDSEFWMDEHARPPVRHHPLELTLARKKVAGGSSSSHPHQAGLSSSQYHADRDGRINATPTLYNGEYTFVLTSAHGLGPGAAVVLSVRGEARAIAEAEGPVDGHLPLSGGGAGPDTGHAHGSPVQPVRVSYKVVPGVRAVPVASGRPATGRALAGEAKYYRFVCQDRHKLVSIRVRPVLPPRSGGGGGGGGDLPMSPAAAAGAMGDPDLYVSNQYEGFVEASRDNCVWRSTLVRGVRAHAFL
jgi:hypothetical protein